MYAVYVTSPSLTCNSVLTAWVSMKLKVLASITMAWTGKEFSAELLSLFSLSHKGNSTSCNQKTNNKLTNQKSPPKYWPNFLWNMQVKICLWQKINNNADVYFRKNAMSFEKVWVSFHPYAWQDQKCICNKSSFSQSCSKLNCIHYLLHSKQSYFSTISSLVCNLFQSRNYVITH